MLDWMKQKLESRFAGRNITNLRYADDTTLTAESKVELKKLLIKMKEESENVGLKRNIQKTKTMASAGSHHFMANRWGNNGNWDRHFLAGGREETAAMKLKDTCSLEEKL